MRAGQPPLPMPNAALVPEGAQDNRGGRRVVDQFLRGRRDGRRREETAHRTSTTHLTPYDDEAVHAAAGPGVQSGQKLTKSGKQGQNWLRLNIKAREGLGVEDDPNRRGAYS